VYYRNYRSDSSQILHSNKDHQILIMGGPNTRTTNPRWQTAAILKKNDNSPYSGNGLPNCYEIWQRNEL